MSPAGPSSTSSATSGRTRCPGRTAARHRSWAWTSPNRPSRPHGSWPPNSATARTARPSSPPTSTTPPKPSPTRPTTSSTPVYGALNWLPDLVRWAETAASLVAPGGFLYLAEFHPLSDVLDDETASRVTYDYFNRDAWVDETPGTYTDFDAPTVNNRSVEWQHPLGDVVSALAGAGLRIEFLHEHDMTMFQRFAALRRAGDGYYRLPADRPRIPLMYSLKATRLR